MFAYYKRSLGVGLVFLPLVVSIIAFHLRSGNLSGNLALIISIFILALGISYLFRPYVGLFDYQLVIYPLWGKSRRGYPIQYLDIEEDKIVVKHKRDLTRLPIRSVWIRSADWDGMLITLEMMVSFRKQLQTPALPDPSTQIISHQE